MAMYMTQSMSSPKTMLITYYRKQAHGHPSHAESGKFTNDARSNYAKFNNISEGVVTVGTYRSSQGIPIGGKTYEI